MKNHELIIIGLLFVVLAVCFAGCTSSSSSPDIPYTTKPTPKYEYEEWPVVVVNSTMTIEPRGEYNEIRVKGLGKNIGSYTLESVWIHADFYDASGNIVHSTNSGRIRDVRNGEFEFEVLFFQHPGMHTWYEDESLITESYKLRIESTR